MRLLRDIVDTSYNLIKPPLFLLTKHDPETAHDLFLLFSKALSLTKLEKLALDNKENHIELHFKISSAAGFDKNAKISPTLLKHLGLDRIVIGTVTGESWKGNKRPRIKRVSKNSLINYVGWANDGAEIISKRLKSYSNSEIPVTISFGPTPRLSLNIEKEANDLEKIIRYFKDISCVTRFEYNLSCPNICVSREDNLLLLKESAKTIKETINPNQETYVKISPDLSEEEIEQIIKLTFDYVKGYVTTNTTTNHNYGFGGGSGEMLWKYSLRIQKNFYKRLKDTDKRIIACGGINSIERIEERIKYGAEEIQIFTPLIFNGPKLLTKIKSYKAFLN